MQLIDMNPVNNWNTEDIKLDTGPLCRATLGPLLFHF